MYTVYINVFHDIFYVMYYEPKLPYITLISIMFSQRLIFICHFYGHKFVALHWHCCLGAYEKLQKRKAGGVLGQVSSLCVLA